MSIRILSFPAILVLFFFPFFCSQIIAIFRETISLRSHQGINGTCQGLCLVIAGSPGLALVFSQDRMTWSHSPLLVFTPLAKNKDYNFS